MNREVRKKKEVVKNPRMREYFQKNREKLLAKGSEYFGKVNYTGFYQDFVAPMVLKRNGGCLDCSSKENLVVHHKHYDFDRLTYYDLETLCKKCHKKKHKANAIKDDLGRKR